MGRDVAIAGGGIGGLTAALACLKAGWRPVIHEAAAQLSEVGAGVQLGPNATRRLHALGLADKLDSLASRPTALSVHDGIGGAVLATMPLGDAMTRRYGSPYLTIHRADLQSLLLQAAREAGIDIQTSSRIESIAEFESDALVGADGLWSAVRSALGDRSAPLNTNHVALRALLEQSSLPKSLRQTDVRVWLAPAMHLVSYPVRCGELLNVVVIIDRGVPNDGDARDWDQSAAASQLDPVKRNLCASARALIDAVPAWRSWNLHDRAPLRSAGEMAKGRVALLGDAAHPMLPYLAQGAAMAIEDAVELGQCLATCVDAPVDVPLALHRYALNRWQRCARVQSQARRNGQIFHASGVVRFGRDAAMRVLGERLLDQPWLYAG